MHIRTLASSAFAISLLAGGLALTGGAARAQTPPPSGYTAAYFVLDFADGTTTPEYAFQDNYTTGANLTASDLLDQLAAKVTAPSAFTQTYTQYSFGRFYTGFSYGAKSQTNPPYTSTSPYWGFWVSNDGTNWTQPQTYGASAAPLASNPWTAFSFGANGGPAPVRPASFSATIITNAAAPEPGTLALLGAGMTFAGACIARRKSAQRAGAMH